LDERRHDSGPAASCCRSRANRRRQCLACRHGIGRHGNRRSTFSSCQIIGGPASLTTGKDNFISLSLVYAPPYVEFGYPTFYFGSAAQLVFNTATTGRVDFDTYVVSLRIPPPPKPKAPVVRFSDYEAVATANPPTLKVSFLLAVGDCTVPVSGIFHQP